MATEAPPLNPEQLQYLLDRRSAELRELLRRDGVIDRLGPGMLAKANGLLHEFHASDAWRPANFPSWPGHGDG
jgi:hypothetical protein